MGNKDKLRKFAENLTFNNLIQPKFSEVFNNDYKYKYNWGTTFFKNNNPIILELGCGKGDYTIALARKFPNINFIGVDIKGARLWRGAKTALEENMSNVAFIRSRVEFLESFFANNEVSEIWITFPDPQKEKRKKRLTSSRFLNLYTKVLKETGIVHLKTDSQELHAYTKELLEFNNQRILSADTNIYNSEILNDILSIKTFYEQGYLSQGKPITYIQFEISGTITEIPDTENAED